ncbi:MAG: DMT family transporter [Anaerolineales bacterium]|jgi:transporter family-2 protein
MSFIRYGLLFAIGFGAGSLITIQSVLNSTLGRRTGVFGSVLLLTLVSLAILASLIAIFPASADFRRIPGISEWYLYLGGILGVAILAVPIFLITSIGATSTLTALVMGQLFLALLVDHFGLFASPRIEASLYRIAGAALVVIGAFLISRG